MPHLAEREEKRVQSYKA